MKNNGWLMPQEEKESCDYKDGLKILKYLKEKTGLPFSFVSDQLNQFVTAFTHYCSEEDLLGRTRAAYAASPFMRQMEELPYKRKTKTLDLRSISFDRALDKCSELRDGKERKKILDTTSLTDVL